MSGAVYGSGMTDQNPDEFPDAVQIVAHYLPFTPSGAATARDIVADLADAGLLHDPRELNEKLAAVGAAALDAGRERIRKLEAEVAALRAVAEAALDAVRVDPNRVGGPPRHVALEAALDALPLGL